jgi:hypothetical protein
MLFTSGIWYVIVGSMSVAEIKQAVKVLSPEELAEVSAFIADYEAAAWDEQLDADFAEGGGLRAVLEEVKRDLSAGHLQDLP